MILPGVSFSFLYQHELSLESPNNVLKHKVTKMSVTIIYVRCIVTMCNGVVECSPMGSVTCANREVLIRICLRANICHRQAFHCFVVPA